MKKNQTNKNCLKKYLYIVATPIGNLDDISERAIRTLKEVDFIICENPKHSLKLLNNKGIKKKLLSMHDHNEDRIISKINKYKENIKIALISDAGSPLISDPGYKFVKYFLDNNFQVTTIPGPSSVISAIQLSGLPINNFAFFGFVPKQKSKIKHFFTKIKNTGLTGIFFVSAINLKTTIKNIIYFLGNKEVCICKELTKINEQIIKDKSDAVLKLLNNNKILLKGEFTLVVAGEAKRTPKIINNNIEKQLILLMKKYNLTEAVKIVHSLTDISKKNIYQMAVKLKND